MKILYLITQAELGGAQAYVKNLCEGLRKENDIIVAYGSEGRENWLGSELDALGVRHVLIKQIKRKISPLSDGLAFVKIHGLIKQEQPDIIHLNSSKISILGSLAGRLYGKAKIIYTVHGWVFNEPARNNGFYRGLEKFTGKFKNKLICVSSHDYEVGKKEKIVPQEKLTTIHNGIKPVNFLHKEQALNVINENLKKSNSKFQIPDSKFLIGSIGNLYKTKGYEYLINAVRHLVDQGHDEVRSVIIGEGKEREELQKWINDLRLQNYVILIGNKLAAHDATLLPAFDLFVNSSVKEGLTTTIIEAMQASLPIVATRVGGNAEMIEDGVTGLLSEPQNSEILTKKIKEIMNSKEHAKTYGQNAEKKAREEFSFEQMIENTKKVYNNPL